MASTTRWSKSDLLRARAEHGIAIADIDKRLAELEAQPSDPWVYTSLDLPKELLHLENPRRAFATHCREKRPVGAKLEGHIWSVPRHSWRESRRRERATMHRDTMPENMDEAIAEQALAGLRCTA